MPITSIPAVTQNETISTITPEATSPLVTPTITSSPQKTGQPKPEETHAATPTLQAVSSTLRPRLKKDDWKGLPIIPDVSDTVLDIYRTSVSSRKQSKSLLENW